jgi:glutathione S-transferase
MKFFWSVGPNPRVVKMFAAEKGLDLDTVTVDLRGGENRRPPYATDVNPAGQTPALQLDDGSVLTEVTAICEYLEEIKPDPVLIGASPEARARTRMWTRRADLKVCEPMANGFRYAEGLPLFESRMRTIPHAAADLKAVAADGLDWFEANMGDGPWLAGADFSLADILLFCFLEFGAAVGQPMDPKRVKIGRWFEAVKARPSAAASA